MNIQPSFLKSFPFAYYSRFRLGFYGAESFKLITNYNTSIDLSRDITCIEVREETDARPNPSEDPIWRLASEKLASSFESREELRVCFRRRKKLRRADMRDRRDSWSRSAKLERCSSSSSILYLEGITPQRIFRPSWSSSQALHNPGTPLNIVLSMWSTSSRRKHSSICSWLSDVILSNWART